MKTKVNIITAQGFIGGIVVVAFSQALAIEPPPDIAEPPAALLNGINNSAIPRIQEEPESNIPFIGVATASVPDMVSDHLALAPGQGVIIRTICPGSPAEKAGLSVNDIILSIGETAVGNPEALSSTVLALKPGDRISVDLIHKGKPAKVEVALAERPVDIARELGRGELMLEGLPEAHADRLRDLIERHLQERDQIGRMNQNAFPQNFRGQVPDVSHPNGLILPEDQLGGNEESSFKQTSTIRVMDSDGSIEMKTINEETEVTVRDEQNRTIWSGPWNSEKDKSAAPDGIRERVGKITPGNGIRFSFGKPGIAAPEAQGR